VYLRGVTVAEKPNSQQPVISVRVSDALRGRLERLKEIIYSKSGSTVSTSEVAKQLLESAREDRLELVELLGDSTESLLRIRHKSEERQLLSQAEWTLVAYYCHQGAEAFANTTPNKISHASLAEILEAFGALYEMQTSGASHRDQYYLSNLPVRTVGVEKKQGETDSALIRRVVKATIAALNNPRKNQWKPTLLARNLYVILEEEKFSNIEQLNDALWSHWDVLWRVCARGHYFHAKQPLRDRLSSEEDLGNIVELPLPMVQHDGYILTFVRLDGGEFSFCLTFPGDRAPLYPLSRYPKISEFRSMFEGFDVSRKASYWRGYYFAGYTSEAEDGSITASFRANDNGITFNFDQAQWQAVKELFRLAWESSEVSRLWSSLVLQYGEL
jgi:hypothetical protein